VRLHVYPGNREGQQQLKQGALFVGRWSAEQKTLPETLPLPTFLISHAMRRLSSTEGPCHADRSVHDLVAIVVRMPFHRLIV
jgi:hypothetical protein